MATLKDIADQTNVTVSTVSRALTGSAPISEQKIDEIKRVALELGYKPKAMVKKGQLDIVGIITPEFMSGYYASLLESLERDFQKSGYCPFFVMSHFNSQSLKENIRILIQKNVKCILAIIDGNGDVIDPEAESLLRESQIPIMIITANYMPATDFDFIYVDDKWGSLLAVDHLISLNHKSIGFIGEMMTLNRQITFCDTMIKNGLPVNENFIKVGEERSSIGGYLRMKELLSENERPTAVYIGYDEMAIGAISAIHEAGLRVPEDISIVSFDNIPASKYICGGLTTIENPIDDMVAIAVRILLDKVKNNLRTVQHVSLNPNIVIRNTAIRI